jgi:hypothetical protein
MKIDLNFGGGYDSILFDFENNKFYSFEYHQEELAEKNKLKITYMSRSELSGSGYIFTNNLIKFGIIRTDCKNELTSEKIMNIASISTWVTYSSHKEINNETLILSDGSRMAFFEIHNRKLTNFESFKKAMEYWDDFWFSKANNDLVKKYTNDYYDEDLKKQNYSLYIYSDHYSNLEYNRFANLEEFKFKREQENNANELFFYFFKVKFYKDHYIHFNKVGIVNKIFTKDEFEKMLSYKGYSYNKETELIYKLRCEKELSEAKRYYYYGFKIKLGLKKYKNEDILFEYENEIGAFEENALEKLSKSIDKNILRKIRINFLRQAKLNLSKEKIIEIIENYKGNLPLEASYRAGNCKIGTKKFLKENNINILEENNKEYITKEDILNNENFNKITKNQEFKNAIFILRK